MKLKILLWLLAQRYKRAVRRSDGMQLHVSKDGPVVQFDSKKGGAKRFFDFTESHLTSRQSLHPAPDLTIRFASSRAGFNIMWSTATGKDKNAFMKGIQDKCIEVEGDPMKLIWFQKSLKYLR